MSPYTAFPLHPVAAADAQHSRRGEASMVEMRDGSVLLAYGRFTGRNDPGYAALAGERTQRYGGSYIERDNDFGEVVAVTLDGAGHLCSGERVLVPCPRDGLNAMNPAFARLPDGRIGLLYSHRLSRHAASRRFLTSSDEGVTWSEPTIVFGENYVSGAHDRFNVLSNGRLLAPVHVTDDWEKHHLQVRVPRSDDGGRSWKISPTITMPRDCAAQGSSLESGCNEPGIAERGDGSLLMTLRTGMGAPFYSESYDAGETWSAPRPFELTSPSAPAHLSRIPGTTDLLLVWNPNYDPGAPMNGHRHTLVAALSSDGGRSWPEVRRKLLVHDPSRNTDYPAVLHRRGEIWIAARQSDDARVIQGRMSTCLMRVPRDWLCAAV